MAYGVDENDAIHEAQSIAELPKVILHVWETREDAQEFIEWRRNRPENRIAALESQLARVQAERDRLREALTEAEPLVIAWAAHHAFNGPTPDAFHPVHQAIFDKVRAALKESSNG